MNREKLDKCLKILEGMTKERWDGLFEVMMREQEIDAVNREKLGESYVNKALYIPAPAVSKEEVKKLFDSYPPSCVRPAD